jgi:endonuclease YncB( thermonuclease family)
VREATGPNSKNSPFYEDLLKAQEAAQAGNKGLWTKVGV